MILIQQTLAAIHWINSGPFFRFSVSGGSLNVAEQTIEGDFFIEKQSNSGGGDRLTVAVQAPK